MERVCGEEREKPRERGVGGWRECVVKRERNREREGWVGRESVW